MPSLLRSLAKRVLSYSWVSRWPVRVRRGVAQGASWTLFPWTAYWRGAHEPECQQLVMTLMDWRGKSVWDLGSHFGLFAVGLGRRVGATGAVAAFEPHPINFQRLKLHVVRNQLNWVQTFPFALSDHAGRDRLLIYGDLGASTTGHLLYDGETWHDDIRYHEVEIVRLDDLLALGKIRAPDFIKVDVEGHGHKALAGAFESIRAHRPVILMGFHSAMEVSETEKLLFPLGYDFFPVKAGQGRDKIGADFVLRPRSKQ